MDDPQGASQWTIKGEGRSHTDDWRRFFIEHAKWIADRARENHAVHPVPSIAVEQMKTCWSLSPEDAATESAFASLCDSVKAIAAIDGWPVFRPVFLDCLPTLSREELDQMPWTAALKKAATDGIRQTADISERLRGCAGRLIATPLFLEQRDELRAEWTALPLAFRPNLPLLASIRCSVTLEEVRLGNQPERLVAFANHLYEFCVRWRVAQMCTWDLPDVDGPKWPDQLSQHSAAKPGYQPFDTPWTFPLGPNDGLGERMMNAHFLLARENGAPDLGRWETYAHLFDVDFWHRILLRRYGAGKTSRGSATACIRAISKLIDRDEQIVRKYRTRLNALQSGRKTTGDRWR